MEIRHSVYELELVNPFGISRETRTHNQVMITRIDDGMGEASPIKYYGEDMDSVAARLAEFSKLDLPEPEYVEDIFDIMENHVAGQAAAKAAVDIALHDRLGKRLGVPLYKLFGKKPSSRMVTSFTIGIDTREEMLRKTREALQYEILKIKLGKEIEHDLQVMRDIRELCGPDKILRVDANGGWTLDEARRALPVMADLGVEYVEQPLEKGNLIELEKLSKGRPVPIFVDEDSMVNRDLPKLDGIVDGVNLKLMKTGGLVEARRMIGTARAYGFQVMIGCMIETSVAITAAAHLAPFCDYLDLDGNILTSNDPFDGVKCDEAGVITLPEGPGLGVTVRSQYENALGLY